MPNITKPTGMSTIWASTGIKTAPELAKIAQGWVVELPPYQTANFIENKQDQFNAHTNQHGIPVWDNDTEYQGGISYTKGSNGKIYKCLVTHKNYDPVNPLNSIYWVEAFEPFGSVAVVAADLATLTLNYGTLSNLTSAAAARNNLSVYSRLESDTRFAALNGSSAQVFSVAPATLGAHAVRLDQLSSLIVQATEATMGVARIASNVDMATGTNDTNIVTPLKGAQTYLRRSLNLSDLASAVAARANLGLGGAAVLNVGTVAGTVAAGDDTRIVNAVQNSRTVVAGNGLTGGGTLASDITLTLGTPGTLSSSSPNAASATSHTHAIDINSFFGPRVLATNGRYTFPGGFKIAWGRTTIPYNQTNTTINLPANFFVSCFGSQLTVVNSSFVGGTLNAYQASLNSDQLVVVGEYDVESTTASVNWFVYGI